MAPLHTTLTYHGHAGHVRRCILGLQSGRNLRRTGRARLALEKREHRPNSCDLTTACQQNNVIRRPVMVSPVMVRLTVPQQQQAAPEIQAHARLNRQQRVPHGTRLAPDGGPLTGAAFVIRICAAKGEGRQCTFTVSALNLCFKCGLLNGAANRASATDFGTDSKVMKQQRSTSPLHAREHDSAPACTGLSRNHGIRVHRCGTSTRLEQRTWHRCSH